jgi:hypothetical protein
VGQQFRVVRCVYVCIWLQALAAAGSLGEAAQHISTNDAVSALVWLTFCNLRGRCVTLLCNNTAACHEDSAKHFAHWHDVRDVTCKMPV